MAISATFTRNERVESAPLENESILYNPDNKQFVKLNATTALIWDRLGDGASMDDIATFLCDHFAGVSPEQAIEDARGALDEMSRLGLVQAS
jgi:hypothetical protein